MLNVTSSNAGSFEFGDRKYFSEAVVTSEGEVRTEDGGILRVRKDGIVGLEEIQK